MNLAGKGRVEKRLKVAQAGQTVDGRQLSPQEIQDMANTYNPALYAGRINIEHILGFSPSPPFNAYGDILAVEAVQENGVWCLYNTISALPNLVEMNKDGQKLYPSIEFYRDFAGTGKAYQVGLAFTDTPASLGTEPLKFSTQRNTVFTQPTEGIFMDTEKKSVLSAIAGLFKPTPSEPVQMSVTPPNDDLTAQNEMLAQAVIVLSQSVSELNEKLTALEQKAEQQNSETVPAQATPQQNADVFANLTAEIQKLSQQLSVATTQTANPAPVATGAVADVTPY